MPRDQAALVFMAVLLRMSRFTGHSLVLGPVQRGVCNTSYELCGPCRAIQDRQDIVKSSDKM